MEKVRKHEHKGAAGRWKLKYVLDFSKKPKSFFRNRQNFQVKKSRKFSNISKIFRTEGVKKVHSPETVLFAFQFTPQL